ncbi:polysaccharide deacetylase family protein [Anabaenopsis tanganyikae CS-531]|uniref:Polysaccharide deacetylase family protein n=2 Tax=Anabaenopsis TaxID=110103 RepID=A0ABT6KAX9_9CYAN|nr:MULTISPECIES: polysaccharide deacetylase family protein [Anabaenopsis]MDB9540474.1 polysaccharide deacetylase family protein [Anabaenopsis arnoldii]MDH6092873.1 polysaccharide deacetylase family protein [Anabaenopsis arnoldii]MDH6104903.1 polysaccharide deacetylase family protein [Anabaenopsis tanganyikae CS-531]
MAKSKTFLWPQGILIALLFLSASLSISLMLFIKPNASDSSRRVAIAQGRRSININNLPAAKVGTQQRIEQLKAAMLNSWAQEANIKGVTSGAPARFQGATIKAGKVNQDQKVIALTFDDGPWRETTSQVLDILKQNNIKATFFVVGQNVKNYPTLVQRVIAEGHAIGNHTWHHWYHYMNPNAAAYEVKHTTEIIYQVTGVKTNLFRPPGGIMHNGLAAYARNNQYAIVLWSSDSLDYSLPSVPNLVNNVFRNAQPGGIVLLHDGGGNRSQTVQALPEIISKFRQQGYSFVTIPELLVMEDKNQTLLANKK